MPLENYSLYYSLYPLLVFYSHRRGAAVFTVAIADFLCLCALRGKTVKVCGFRFRALWAILAPLRACAISAHTQFAVHRAIIAYNFCFIVYVLKIKVYMDGNYS
jgi:hypothetical protein